MRGRVSVLRNRMQTDLIAFRVADDRDRADGAEGGLRLDDRAAGSRHSRERGVELSVVDRDTLMTHSALWVLERESERPLAPLSRLTEAEQELYDELRHDVLGNHVRLEQERISFSALERALSAACTA